MQLFKTEMIFVPLSQAHPYRARRRRYGCRTVPPAVQPRPEALRPTPPTAAVIEDRQPTDRAA